MTKQKLKALSIGKLRNNDFLSLCRLTVSRMMPLEASLDPMIVSVLKKIEADAIQFEALIKLQRGSILTPKILALDRRRDLQCRELLRRIKYLSETGNHEQKEHTAVIYTFLKPHGKLHHPHINAETSTVHTFLIAIFKNNEVKNSFKALDLMPMLVQLESLNQSIDSLSFQRDAEYTARKERKGSSMNARNILKKSYTNLCNMVTTLMQLSPTPMLEKVFAIMNVHRQEYSILLQQRGTKGYKSANYRNQLAIDTLENSLLLPSPRLGDNTEASLKS